MRYLLAIVFIAAVLGMPAAHADDQQQQETVTIPKSMLSQDQLNELKKQTEGKTIRENVSAWAGLGKEVGEAMNSSMQAITERTNEFAQTRVGKLTMILVTWRVLGDQAIHLLSGFFEAIVFIPIFIWSYRKTCMTRRVKTGKDQWQVVEYKSSAEVTPRVGHAIAVMLFAIVWLATVFSY
jgi:hypothetical protein